MGLRAVNTDKILTVIGKDTLISGTLQGDGPVRIDGQVEGEINISGDIIIGEGAVIRAQIKGKNVQVAGKVTGNIEAAGKLDVLATGIVEGDVKVSALQVADGAKLAGSCAMSLPAHPDKSETSNRTSKRAT